MNERNFRTNANEGSDMLHTEHNNYRRAFWIAVTTTAVLAIVASVLWWRLSHAESVSQPGNSSASESMKPTAQTSSANASGSEPGAGGDSQAGNMQETPLAAIQLTPQRMQSIGIVIGKVESKPVSTELRFYGNVQVDERRQAYVQTRFAGWIRKVYADATGNFIGKGQPLFTIYSPDLVSTEHEYLLAKKNSESLQQSKVTGVASGASSLFSAAKERLRQWEVSTAEIEKLDQGGKAITDLTVNSRDSGYITQKNALPNMYVQPENLLFVYKDEGSIEPREVELGPQVGDELVVTKGIKAQEQIVTSANFLIDSEAQLQAAAGAFVPPPPGAGQAASMNAPAQQQANVELTTDPDPPHKGSNTVRVKLTDGKPIAGANVTVTFFMAAMPAMGMAATKTVVNASDKGGGMYEGKGDLGSGGTWQVTVRAQQNGQTIANKQLTLNATGGM